MLMNVRFNIIQTCAINKTLWQIIPLVSYPNTLLLSNIKSTSSFEQFLGMASSIILYHIQKICLRR